MSAHTMAAARELLGHDRSGVMTGFLHLLYHIEHPHLYTPSKKTRTCRFCHAFMSRGESVDVRGSHRAGCNGGLSREPLPERTQTNAAASCRAHREETNHR